MALIALIYVSSAARSLTGSDIKDILTTSRADNAEKDITGLLLFKDGNFMQVLEGESAVVDELQQKIAKDPRHSGLITLPRWPIQSRNFSDWKMGFKNLTDLTPAEQAGRSDYLDRPFNDASYVSNPNEAFMLLDAFKQTVR